MWPQVGFYSRSLVLIFLSLRDFSFYLPVGSGFVNVGRVRVVLGADIGLLLF